MPQSLAHIALIVRDYEEATVWFTQKLGFTLAAPFGGCARPTVKSYLLPK